MYDDEYQAPWSVSDGARFYKVARFPTRNIKTPIYTVYGGSDSLVDIKIMLKELPKHTIAKEIPHYEHLDFLWAQDVDKVVFPHVYKALEKFAAPEDAEGNLTFLDKSGKSFAEAVAEGTEQWEVHSLGKKHSQNIPRYDGATDTAQSSSSRPEGWWSSDELAGTETPTTKSPIEEYKMKNRMHAERAEDNGTKNVRDSPSRSSLESLLPKAKGISLGKSNSVGSVTMSMKGAARSESETDEKKRKKKK